MPYESPRVRNSIQFSSYFIWSWSTFSWDKYSVAPLLRNTEPSGFGRIFRDLCAEKNILHSESPGLDVRASCCPAISQAPVPTRKTYPSTAIITTRRAPPDHTWHRRMRVIPCMCLYHHPVPSSAVPFLMFRVSALWSSLTSLMMQYHFFHVNVCPENLPLSVPPRRRVFTRKLFYELELAPLLGENDGHSNCGVGRAPGTVFWISWIFRMALLIRKCDILVLCIWIQC